MPDTVTPAAPTITELFARAVGQWKDNVAFRVKRDGEWAAITFGEFPLVVMAIRQSPSTASASTCRANTRSKL